MNNSQKSGPRKTKNGRRGKFAHEKKGLQTIQNKIKKTHRS